MTDKVQREEKIYGLLIMHEEQKPIIDRHCFGDCGKISMAGAIMDDLVGALMVCCEEECPYLDKQMEEPYGKTMSFGRPHAVYLRTLKEPPMTDKPEELTKEEFCRRFRERMLQMAGPKFDDGESVAEYADEVAPTYWATKWQREEGPEACADADISYWGED